jgi:hypothetical protein
VLDGERDGRDVALIRSGDVIRSSKGRNFCENRRNGSPADVQLGPMEMQQHTTLSPILRVTSTTIPVVMHCSDLYCMNTALQLN